MNSTNNPNLSSILYGTENITNICHKRINNLPAIMTTIRDNIDITGNIHHSPIKESLTQLTQQSKQQQRQLAPITTPKMGSRRIFSAHFKLQVLNSYRHDCECKGNQRATARKYNIHRRQIQKWLQCEQNLRLTVNNSNNNNNNNNNDNTKKLRIPPTTTVKIPSNFENNALTALTTATTTTTDTPTISTISQTPSPSLSTSKISTTITNANVFQSPTPSAAPLLLQPSLTPIPIITNTEENILSLGSTRHTVALNNNNCNNKITNNNNNNTRFLLNPNILLHSLTTPVSFTPVAQQQQLYEEQQNDHHQQDQQQRQQMYVQSTSLPNRISNISSISTINNNNINVVSINDNIVDVTDNNNNNNNDNRNNNMNEHLSIDSNYNSNIKINKNVDQTEYYTFITAGPLPPSAAVAPSPSTTVSSPAPLPPPTPAVVSQVPPEQPHSSSFYCNYQEYYDNYCNQSEPIDLSPKIPYNYVMESPSISSKIPLLMDYKQQSQQIYVKHQQHIKEIDLTLNNHYNNIINDNNTINNINNNNYSMEQSRIPLTTYNYNTIITDDNVPWDLSCTSSSTSATTLKRKHNEDDDNNDQQQLTSTKPKLFKPYLLDDQCDDDVTGNDNIHNNSNNKDHDGTKNLEVIKQRDPIIWNIHPINMYNNEYHDLTIRTSSPTSLSSTSFSPISLIELSPISSPNSISPRMSYINDRSYWIHKESLSATSGYESSSSSSSSSVDFSNDNVDRTRRQQSSQPEQHLHVNVQLQPIIDYSVVPQTVEPPHTLSASADSSYQYYQNFYNNDDQHYHQTSTNYQHQSHHQHYNLNNNYGDCYIY